MYKRIRERSKATKGLVVKEHGVSVTFARLFSSGFVRSVVDYRVLNLLQASGSGNKSFGEQQEAMRLIVDVPRSERMVNLRLELNIIYF